MMRMNYIKFTQNTVLNINNFFFFETHIDFDGDESEKKKMRLS